MAEESQSEIIDTPCADAPESQSKVASDAENTESQLVPVVTATNVVASASVDSEPKRLQSAKAKVDEARAAVAKWEQKAHELSQLPTLSAKQEKKLQSYQEKVNRDQKALQDAIDNLDKRQRAADDAAAAKKSQLQSRQHGLSVRAVQSLVRIRCSSEALFAGSGNKNDKLWEKIAEQYMARVRSGELQATDARMWTAIKLRFLDEQAAFRVYSAHRASAAASGCAMEDLDAQCAWNENDTTQIFLEFNWDRKPAITPPFVVNNDTAVVGGQVHTPACIPLPARFALAHAPRPVLARAFVCRTRQAQCGGRRANTRRRLQDTPTNRHKTHRHTTHPPQTSPLQTRPPQTRPPPPRTSNPATGRTSTSVAPAVAVRSGTGGHGKPTRPRPRRTGRAHSRRRWRTQAKKAPPSSKCSPRKWRLPRRPGRSRTSAHASGRSASETASASISAGFFL